MTQHDKTASPSSGGVRDALELAYGLLWVVGCDRATLGGNALYLARKALLEQLDKAGQGRGITAARKVLNDEGAASGARYRVCCPADFYTLHRTDGGTSDASIGGGASGSLAALRDDGDSEGPTSADGLSAAIDALVSADGVREDECLVPKSDRDDLDDVCRELGIQDSHVTPAEAVRELHAEIELLRTKQEGHPAPADDAAVAWQYRFEIGDGEWSEWQDCSERFARNRVNGGNKYGDRKAEVRPLFTHPAKAVDVEAVKQCIQDHIDLNTFKKNDEGSVEIDAAGLVLTLSEYLTTGNASSETEGHAHD